MSPHGKSLLLLVCTTLLWSTSGVLIKSIDWNPLAISSSRSLVAALVIAFLARNQISWKRPDAGQLTGGVFLALVSVSFVSATKLTTAANVIFLQYMAPVWVAILAPLILKEPTARRDWFFIALTFSGLGMFFMDSLSMEGFWGIILAIFCGLCFAAMAITVRVVKDSRPFQSMIYGNIMVAVLGLFFIRPPWPSAGEVGLLIFAGVIQYGLPFYLYAKACAGVSSLELVLVTSLEAVFNPLWVFLIINERPGNWALVGGSVVLAAVTAWSVVKILKPLPAPDRQ